MEEKILSTKISVSPKYMNNNIKHHIEVELKKRITPNLIIKNVGQIKSIQSIISISDGVVRPIDNFIVFTVKYKVISFNPKVGDIVNVKISSNMSPHGLICSIYGVNIFIEERENDNFSNYKINQQIKVKLSAVRIDTCINACGCIID